jgi:Fuc2NAc and GlcNAc transferase
LIATILATALFLVSAITTRQLVANSHRLSTLDIPNERSSHLTPTPRGGGIAFVTTSLVGFLLLLLNNSLDAAEILDRTIETGIIGSILGVLYLVWLLNLFNFMDGTDGIAASEALFVCVAGAILNFYVLSDINFSAVAIVLTASTFGFILYNWSPAKIFMGDVGSGYLGIAIGGLSLMAAKQQHDLLWVWIILLAVFVSDATITLIRRLLRKQRPHVAHRSHAYQHLAIRFNSHAKVSFLVLAVNIVWLLPIAFFVADKQLAGTTGVVVAYVPLLVAALALNAGKDSVAN